MRCTICQRFLPKTARMGTKFCGTNCRSRAYRLREQPSEMSAHGPSTGTGKSQGLPDATRESARANNPVTIPAVLKRLQQVRERAGLAPPQVDPMLAYQANLDALLTEHMATRRILATHVTDAGQVTRGNPAGLEDPSTTQVGIGVSLTERGDSIVIILLGRQVADAHPLASHSAPKSAPIMPPMPHAAMQQVIPQAHETPAVDELSRPRLTHLTEVKLWHGSIRDDQSMQTRPSDDFEVAETDAIPPSNEDEPET